MILFLSRDIRGEVLPQHVVVRNLIVADSIRILGHCYCYASAVNRI